MSRAKRIARIFFAAVLLLLCGCETASKKDAVQSAHAFLQLLSQGKTEDAYKTTAFAFQAQQSLKNFEGTAKELGLGDYTSLTWTRQTLGDKEAKLQGEIATKSGGKIVVAVTMIQESGDWKLYALRTPGGGGALPVENRFSIVGKGAAFYNAYDKAIPAEPQIRSLVRESMLRFDDAIRREDFGDFFKYLSALWQSQLLEQRLRMTFQPFIDSKVDFRAIKNLEPVFDPPPHINSNGLLLVSGHYPMQPHPLLFRLLYTYEMPKWKLFGIDVEFAK